MRSTDLDAHADVRVVQYTNNLQEQLDFKFTRSVPPTWNAKLASQRTGPHPLFWWRIQIMRYIWRFQPRVENILSQRRESVLESLGLQKDIE